MQIKVNGLCHADDIRRVAQSGADYVGMQFGKGKPHRVVMLQRSTGTLPDMAEADFSSLSSEGAGRALSLVGMFSGESAQSVITAVYSTMTVARSSSATLSVRLCPTSARILTL